MSQRGPGFGRFASALALWSCVAAKDGACPTCGEALGSEEVPAVGSGASASPAGFCGDGVWDPEQEECDDGSACRDGRNCTDDRLRCQSTSASACQPRSSDGCSDQCAVEPGYSCRDGRNCRPLDPSISEASPAPEVQSPGEAVDAAVPLRDGAVRTPDTRGPAGLLRPERCRRPRFQPPELVTGLDTTLDLWAPSLASDGRTLLVAANQQGLLEHIFFAARNGRVSQFSPLTLLAGVDSGSGDGTPVLSADGLTLYFYSTRAGGSGDRDLWFATRADASADFGAASRFGAVNGAAQEHLPWVSPDELKMLYVSTRPGGLGQADIWLAKRERRSDDFGEPDLFSSISSSAEEGRAVESSDGTLVVFASSREGGQGNLDLWFSVRDDLDEEFEKLTNLRELNSSGLDVDPFLSADERELFFASTRNGKSEVWRSLIDCDD